MSSTFMPTNEPSFEPVEALPGIPVRLPPGMTADLSVGAVIVSTWSSIFAFTVVCILVYLYFDRFSHDSLGLKIVVAAGLCLAAIDTAANCIWCYDWIVTLWGSIPGAGLVPKAFYVNILCATFSASLVQCFYAWRLWLMSGGKPYIPAIIICATTAQFVTGIYSVSRWAIAHSLMRNIADALPYAWGWLSCNIFTDTVISVVMLHYLRVGTRHTPSLAAKTKVSIRGVISRTIQANVFSLISQIATFLLFKLNVGMYFFWNDVVITKVYVFSLLITLNARRSSSALYNVSTIPQLAPNVEPDVGPEWSGASMAKPLTYPTLAQEVDERSQCTPDLQHSDNEKMDSEGGTSGMDIVDVGLQGRRERSVAFADR
ncbi:hypothetical protein BKA62DRAFT_832977 [Auriculariales sp. MPI-PUGE-AT-0066]|nr:hypothetical protein BKA62DRAFT_832977 [Auriculariales sp. MPI-PUGE-AT-0066]